MSVQFQIRVYDTAGNLNTVLDVQRDVLNFEIQHRVNYPSKLTLRLYGLSPVVQQLSLDAVVQVLRTDPSTMPATPWYTEFVGLHRTPRRQITKDSARVFTSTCLGPLDLIARRSIRYYIDTNGSAKGPAPADDIIKDYVNENAGPLATVANGRITAGITSGLLVAAHTSKGPSISAEHSWKNLLSVIRELGEANHVDFAVVWNGANSFTFTTYYPQLGTDRRSGTASPAVFSTLLGNMSEPDYTQHRTDEVNDVLVVGPGQGNLRDTTHRSNSHTTDSLWNLHEEDKDASSVDRTDALNNIGDQVLYDKRPAVKFLFDPIQTPSSFYGQHYFLGDLITAQFDDVGQVNMKIRAVTITVNNAAERIKLELEELP